MINEVDNSISGSTGGVNEKDIDLSARFGDSSRITTEHAQTSTIIATTNRRTEATVCNFASYLFITLILSIPNIYTNMLAHTKKILNLIRKYNF